MRKREREKKRNRERENQKNIKFQSLFGHGDKKLCLLVTHQVVYKVL